MDCSTPGLPVLHQLPELTQTHVHGVSDAIQPSPPLSSPSPLAFSLSQHQGLFQWVDILVGKLSFPRRSEHPHPPVCPSLGTLPRLLGALWSFLHLTLNLPSQLGILILDFSCWTYCVVSFLTGEKHTAMQQNRKSPNSKFKSQKFLEICHMIKVMSQIATKTLNTE